MYKVLIWGIGKEYNLLKNILHSKEILLDKQELKRESCEIVGYVDRDLSKAEFIDKFIMPEQIAGVKPDLILTPNSIKDEIIKSLESIQLSFCHVMSFMEFIRDRLVVHPQAVGDGSSVYKYAKEVLERTNIEVKNIFEIGANYGQDSEFLRLMFGLSPSCVYTFEAHPDISKEIQKWYRFNNYNCAVSDLSGVVNLHAVRGGNNSGLSTIAADFRYASRYEIIEVDCIRMDDFLLKHSGIDEIDFCKIDAEGVNYKVLRGFGKDLGRIKCIQIEAECMKEFEGHYIFKDIALLLIENGFELVSYDLSRRNSQSDSLWVRRDCLKSKEEFDV